MSAQDEFDCVQVLAIALDNVIAVAMTVSKTAASDHQRELAYGLYECADKLFGAVHQFDARVRVEDRGGKLSADSYVLRKTALSKLLALFNAANNCGEVGDD